MPVVFKPDQICSSEGRVGREERRYGETREEEDERDGLPCQWIRRIVSFSHSAARLCSSRDSGTSFIFLSLSLTLHYVSAAPIMCAKDSLAWTNCTAEIVYVRKVGVRVLEMLMRSLRRELTWDQRNTAATRSPGKKKISWNRQLCQFSPLWAVK